MVEVDLFVIDANISTAAYTENSCQLLFFKHTNILVLLLPDENNFFQRTRLNVDIYITVCVSRASHSCTINTTRRNTSPFSPGLVQG